MDDSLEAGDKVLQVAACSEKSLSMERSGRYGIARNAWALFRSSSFKYKIRADVTKLFVCGIVWPRFGVFLK